MSEALQTTPSCACSRRARHQVAARPPISSTVYRHPEVKSRLTSSRGHQDGSRSLAQRITMHPIQLIFSAFLGLLLGLPRPAKRSSSDNRVGARLSVPFCRDPPRVTTHVPLLILR